MSAKKRKNINLLPREDFDKTTLGRILRWSLTTFRYIVITVELIVVAGFLSRFYFDVQIGNLNDDIKQQSAAIAARYEFEQRFRKTQLKLSILSSLGDESNSVLPIVEALAQNIPQDSQIVRITKKESEVTIVMATLSETSALSFVSGLRQTPIFKDVAIKRVESNDSSPYTTYTLNGILNFTN